VTESASPRRREKKLIRKKKKKGDKKKKGENRRRTEGKKSRVHDKKGVRCGIEGKGAGEGLGKKGKGARQKKNDRRRVGFKGVSQGCCKIFQCQGKGQHQGRGKSHHVAEESPRGKESRIIEGRNNKPLSSITKKEKRNFMWGW